MKKAGEFLLKKSDNFTRKFRSKSGTNTMFFGPAVVHLTFLSLTLKQIRNFIAYFQKREICYKEFDTSASFA